MAQEKSPSIVCAVKLEKAWKIGLKHTAGPVFSIQTLFTIAISAIDVAHHHPTEASGRPQREGTTIPGDWRCRVSALALDAKGRMSDHP